ncbi:O-acetyl-ADP-ribose deacetylase (regulator of RNase III) [Peptoniphilus olsenii]|uniref:O-acetyl-ADP-ribose deacetylase (Regulator of RNase III) n=1 Tax=Peptoniphilus olsenii TaxID=411570 RepID=A0ABV2JA87_9FIRM
MTLKIEKKSIIDFNVDAIVNAANANLQRGSGVCGVIFEAANSDDLQKECDKLAPIEPGEAVITKGYNLQAKYIIHAVGPVYFDGNRNEDEILKKAYLSSLHLAKKEGLKSIVFPLISSGIYGYPKREAALIAVNTIKEFLTNNDMDITIATLDQNIFDILNEINSNY